MVSSGLLRRVNLKSYKSMLNRIYAHVALAFLYTRNLPGGIRVVALRADLPRHL
jgi:hypothetical protein